MAVTISGTYRPVVVDVNGNAADDIIWYAPGAAADSIWIFGAGATRSQLSTTINGDYQPITGRFGDAPGSQPQERVLFAKPGGMGAIWTFDAEAAHTSTPFPTPSGRPIVGDFLGDGRDGILWYGPGGYSESFTFFNASGAGQSSPAPQVGGTYEPVVLDFDGNGRQDIAWSRIVQRPRTGDGVLEPWQQAIIWLFADVVGGYTQASWEQRGSALVAPVFSDPADV
jgi:hypothetical protein